MSAYVEKFTHFDDLGGIVTEVFVCGGCGFDRKFDDFDALFEVLTTFLL